jgi:F-type H+-transporting ATPase subunit epsilon
MKIKFKIVTPERTVYEDEVDQATLPVSNGEVTILPNHRSYIASLKPGELMIKKGQKEINMAISGGFIEFANNDLVVLADTAERAEEIDVKAAEEARKRAEDIKSQKTMDETEYARIAAAIETEAARLKVARKRRTKHGMKLEQ